MPRAAPPLAHRPLRRAPGFTLVEVLVALAVMAVLALLSWRGVDTLLRTEAGLRERSQTVHALQAGLNQWGMDLDAMIPWPADTGLRSLDWDGRVLRLTRQAPASGPGGVQVVAWTRRSDAGAGQWLRWQSPVLRNRADWNRAWLQAAQWNDAGAATLIAPLQQWDIFYHRNNSWSHPLSSDAGTLRNGAAAASGAALPDGVRLVLTLPDTHPLGGGPLVRDWVRPTLGGGKS